MHIESGLRERAQYDVENSPARLLIVSEMVSVPGESPGINVPPIRTSPLMMPLPPRVPPWMFTIAPPVAVRIPSTMVLSPVWV